ncbi:MAG: hypothetical protein Tsb0015_08480 [Simkaniaceae bacterium]
MEYDQAGRCVYATDPLGRESRYKYDDFGNVIWEKNPDKDTEIHYRYDFSNRLLEKKEITSDGLIYAEHYGYDLKGNRIKTIDAFGNETIHKYDSYGNEQATIFPKNLQEKSPKIQRTFNLSHQIASETDGEGNTTKKSYNVLGKPTKIIKPDGATETYIYRLDGTLQKSISPSRAETQFTLDYQERPLTKKTFSKDGKLLQEENFAYSAFHLLRHKDAEGVETFYHYDGAGRKIRSSQQETSHPIRQFNPKNHRIRPYGEYPWLCLTDAKKP